VTEETVMAGPPLKSCILVFDPGALGQRFGPEHPERLRPLLRELAAVQGEAGLSAELLEVPARRQPGAAGLRRILEEHHGAPCGDRAYLLVGGGDVLPPFSLPDPTAPDQRVFSDQVHGASGPGLEDLLDRDRSPVGRLPGEPGAEGDAGGEALEEQVRWMIRAHRRGPPRAGTFALSAAVWRESTEGVLAALPSRRRVLELSDPLRLGDLEPERLADRAWIHFNLHGRPEDPYWRGTGEPSWKRRRVVEPQALLQARVAGAVVFSQCCFGARTRGRTRHTSNALALLHRGVRCYVGCLETSYGSDGERQKELEESDVVAHHFWRLVRAGERTGTALVEAQRRFGALARASRQGLDEDDHKTLLTFALYGDPSLRGAADGDDTALPGRSAQNRAHQS